VDRWQSDIFGPVTLAKPHARTTPIFLDESDRIDEIKKMGNIALDDYGSAVQSRTRGSLIGVS
jgi:hypothetical protein